MLIKKLITTVQEESFEIGLPIYLKERSEYCPYYAMLTDTGAVRVTSGKMIWFDEFNVPEKEASKYISDCIEITEEEFFKRYNAALAFIQGKLMPQPALA